MYLRKLGKSVKKLKKHKNPQPKPYTMIKEPAKPSSTEEVKEKDYGVNTRAEYPLSDRATLHLAQGSVVYFTGDSIVNAANSGCLGGAGVDGAINDRGGRDLMMARRALPEVSPGVRCKTGDAVITVGGRLKAKFVIHAVGPIFSSFKKDTEDSDAKLRSAYMNALERATEKDGEITSVAFSLLSSGIYRGSKSMEEVLGIGMLAIKDYFVENPETKVTDVFMVAFKEIAEMRPLLTLGKKIFLGEQEEEEQEEEDDTPAKEGNSEKAESEKAEDEDEVKDKEKEQDEAAEADI